MTAAVAALLALLAVVAVLTMARRGREAFTVGAQIINGDPAPFTRYPYMCKLPGCTGVLIAPRWVLTAAHCSNVRQGAQVIIGGSEARTASVVVRHPGWTKGGSASDLALVLLDKPSSKQPIRLAARAPATGTSVTVVGFGLKQPPHVPRSPKPAPALTKATMMLHPGIGPTGRDPRYATISSYTQSACAGDSGGPVILERAGPAQDELVSIHQGQRLIEGRKCVRNEYGMYVNWGNDVSFPSHRTWIQDVLAARLTATQLSGACGLYSRANGRQCPPAAPWDAGVWSSPYHTPFILKDKHCATTEYCATTLRNLIVRNGGKGQPVRYRPVY